MRMRNWLIRFHGDNVMKIGGIHKTKIRKWVEKNKIKSKTNRFSFSPLKLSIHTSISLFVPFGSVADSFEDKWMTLVAWNINLIAPSLLPLLCFSKYHTAQEWNQSNHPFQYIFTRNNNWRVRFQKVDLPSVFWWWEMMPVKMCHAICHIIRNASLVVVLSTRKLHLAPTYIRITS